MSALSRLAPHPALDGVVVPDDEHGVKPVPVRGPAESPNAAMGLILGQARVTSVDNGVSGLSLGAVERRLDRPVARARIQALELDRYTVHPRVGRASVD